nr:hypothetical protein [Tanacetum cinerariifolium]
MRHARESTLTLLQSQGDGGSDGCGGGAWCWRCGGDEVVTAVGMTRRYILIYNDMFCESAKNKEQLSEKESKIKYTYLKLIDIVDDFSDYHFNSAGFQGQQPLRSWKKKIQDEWNILEKHLPTFEEPTGLAQLTTKDNLREVSLERSQVRVSPWTFRGEINRSKSEDGTTRTKKYEELYAIENIQADCDCKATNIVLQCIPPDVYAIVNHHKVAKEIWDRVKLLMQGTKLSLQEKECKLYDEFDKFTFVNGKTLYQYYWRFAQLINNMNVINMSMRPVQVNTKFLNSLPPE